MSKKWVERGYGTPVRDADIEDVIGGVIIGYEPDTYLYYPNPVAVFVKKGDRFYRVRIIKYEDDVELYIEEVDRPEEFPMG